MAHGHPVLDTDSHFIIDPITRSITNAASKKTLLMQNDHNSERFSFEIDRYIEEHDMLLCDKIELHFINVDSATKEKSIGVYEIDDFAINKDDATRATFTWLVSENATKYAGSLNFLVLFACTDGDQVVYRWNTAINNSIIIAKGMNNGEPIAEIYPDILLQWKNDLFSRNYAYEGAVKNGFEGTEKEWYDDLVAAAKNEFIWSQKQDTLEWITTDDIDAMFAGNYTETEGA